jgi:hypothetical protein
VESFQERIVLEREQVAPVELETQLPRTFKECKTGKLDGGEETDF